MGQFIPIEKAPIPVLSLVSSPQHLRKEDTVLLH